MEDNKMEIEEGVKFSSVLSAIRKNIVLIIIIIVLGTIGGLGLSFGVARTTYTARRSVLLHASVGEGTIGGDTNNNATLTKLILSNIADNLLFEDIIINSAQEIYEAKGHSGKIDSKDLSTSRDTAAESMIFYINYTDYESDVAIEKLNSIIESFNNLAKTEEGPTYMTGAKDVSLIDLQNKRTTITSSSGRLKFVLIGFAIGIVVALLVVYLKSIFDTTVKSREDFEDLTGISVLACINKQENL